MEKHFWNLCSRSWDSLLSRLSPSTLSVVVFSLAVPVLIFVAMLIYNFVRARKLGTAMGDILKTSAIPSLIAAGLTMLAWIVLFGWSVASTIYKDHQDFVSYIPKVKQ